MIRTWLYGIVVALSITWAVYSLTRLALPQLRHVVTLYRFVEAAYWQELERVRAEQAFVGPLPPVEEAP